MAAPRPWFVAFDRATHLPPESVVRALATRLQLEALDPAFLDAMVQSVLASTAFQIDVPAAAGTWTLQVPPALGRVPEVSVYLQSGEQVFADVVASATQVTVTFAAPTSGFVILT